MGIRTTISVQPNPFILLPTVSGQDPSDCIEENRLASAPCQAIQSGLEMEICALSRLYHRICARGHAHESWRQAAPLPVHEILKHRERPGFGRVYDIPSGADPAAAPKERSRSADRWVLRTDDTAGALVILRREDHEGLSRSPLRLHGRRSRSAQHRTENDPQVPDGRPPETPWPPPTPRIRPASSHIA